MPSIRMADLLDGDRLRALVEAQLAYKNVIIEQLCGHEPMSTDAVLAEIARRST